jgi:hypothetical protein
MRVCKDALPIIVRIKSGIDTGADAADGLKAIE